MQSHVLYAELTPREFRERLSAAPIAYLPLGTLEWHGEQLPLGADGLQSQGFFVQLAERIGGIVLPMLFVGPDKKETTEDGRELYGMDIWKPGMPPPPYREALPGSAYWVPDETFGLLIEGILKQLRRAGFRIVVAHGHGPSTRHVRDHAADWQKRLDLDCYTCWQATEPNGGSQGIQTDHAAMNETSLCMALRPDLVHMEYLPADLSQWPLGVWGQDPRTQASAELGRQAITTNLERMSGLLRTALARLHAPATTSSSHM